MVNYRAFRAAERDVLEHTYAQALQHFEHRMSPEDFEAVLTSIRRANSKSRVLGQQQKRHIVKQFRRDKPHARRERSLQRSIDRLDRKIHRAHERGKGSLAAHLQRVRDGYAAEVAQDTRTTVG